MLILMKSGFTPEQMDQVVQKIKRLGYTPHIIPGDHDTAVGITGNDRAIDPEEFSMLAGVKDAVRVTKFYKLVARAVKQAGANVLRGGAYKPRTSPYAFQGMGVDGLKILDLARKETGLPVITEVLDMPSLEKVNEYSDIIQIGVRNMQNFSLLQEVGKMRKPVLLKRGMSATLDEWLQAAEYILSQGNEEVILCERGIRSYDPATRNLVDLASVPAIRELSHLPVLVDPSHGTGRKSLVIPVARAALAVGAQAVMVDVHDRPAEALCDGPQAISPTEFGQLVTTLKQMAEILGVQTST
jgi:3-deoxy-7-phosphoheptulonate synthase